MTDHLRGLIAFMAALETHGSHAFPCAICGRVGDVRVHDLHEWLAALLSNHEPNPDDPFDPPTGHQQPFETCSHPYCVAARAAGDT